MVLLMFVTGIAFVGIVHQVGWLAASEEPLLVPRIDLPDLDSESNLVQIGLGTLNGEDIYGSLPTRRVGRDRGRAAHSWLTKIAFFLPVDPGDIDYDRPWDDPKNAPWFKRFVYLYLNPQLGEITDRRGFALSHYAGNRQVLDRDDFFSTKQATDGASTTILAGEVVEEFRAWGDPASLRDPAAGLYRGGQTFGGPEGKGANFVFLDGSVRFFSKDTSPQVLQSLATPTGAEPVAAGSLPKPKFQWGN
jgi:prepilin-type processing-associated H-X9-DG protein